MKDRIKIKRELSSSDSDSEAFLVRVISQEKREEEDEEVLSSKRRKRRRDAGRRVIGGRIYDSQLGKTCHWCRQKTVDTRVNCSVKGCGNMFCRGCLKNRHGEDIHEQTRPGVKWVCPKCRGGCGPGCDTNCCNCGPCRKKRGLPCTGLMVHEARVHGFTNVHDYLIHLKTGESPETVWQRKVGRHWMSEDGNTGTQDVTCSLPTPDKPSVLVEVRATDCDSPEVTPPPGSYSPDATTGKRMRGALRGALLFIHLSQIEEQHQKSMETPEAHPELVKSEQSDSDDLPASKAVRMKQELLDDEPGLGSVKNEPATKTVMVKRKELDEEPVNMSERLPNVERFSTDAGVKSEMESVELSDIKEKSEDTEEDTEGNEACNYGHLLSREPVTDKGEDQLFVEQEQRALEHVTKCNSSPMVTVKQEPVEENEEERPTVRRSVVDEPDSDKSDDDGDGFLHFRDDALVYKQRLDKELSKPFDADELEALLKEVNFQKPVLKLREMRRRTVSAPTKRNAPSYLEQFPDLASKVTVADSEEQLRLLRGFFFWLQHACNTEAFKPWIPSSTREHWTDDCYEVGRDCEVTAEVVLVNNRRTAKHLPGKAPGPKVPSPVVKTELE